MEYVEIGGVKYKVLKVENGIPVLKATSEEIKHEDGSIEVIIRPEPLKLTVERN